MKIFDSKSSKKISFNPLKEGKVSLYVCGMTVYDSCHIGHLRTFLSFDFIALVSSVEFKTASLGAFCGLAC